MSRDATISATNPLYDEVVEPSQVPQHVPGNVHDDSYSVFVPLRNVQTESNGAAKSEAAIPVIGEHPQPTQHPPECSGSSTAVNLVTQEDDGEYTLPIGKEQPAGLQNEEPTSNDVAQPEKQSKSVDLDGEIEPVDSLHPLRKMQEEPSSIPIVHHGPLKRAKTVQEESDGNSQEYSLQTDEHIATVNEEPAVVDAQQIDAVHVVEEEHQQMTTDEYG